MNARTAPTRESPSIILTHGGTYRETCRGEIDFGIQGLPLSAVQEHDYIRKQAVQKLIHQFENHPQRSTTRKSTTKSRVQSVQREVEGFYLQHGKHGVPRKWRDHSTHTTPQLHDRHCILHMRNMLATFKVRKLNSDRCDVLSIPSYVIFNGPSHGRPRGNTEKQRIYCHAKLSSNKAKKKGYKSIQIDS